MTIEGLGRLENRLILGEGPALTDTLVAAGPRGTDHR